jgi:hypothetical protein
MLQVPAPLHLPSPPHGGDVGHIPSRAGGGCSYATGPHVPSAPDCLSDARHVLQIVLHAVSQQTPSTQLPVAHSRHAPDCLQSEVRLHACPCACWVTHWPEALQK